MSVALPSTYMQPGRQHTQPGMVGGGHGDHDKQHEGVAVGLSTMLHNNTATRFELHAMSHPETGAGFNNNLSLSLPLSKKGITDPL